MSTASVGPPTARDFLTQHRGGGWYSEIVSQRLGALLAVAAHRLGLPPAAVTVLGLLTGVGASMALVLSADATATATSAVPALATGLAAGAGWQLAYALDCADGQLARVTGRASPAGARLDILCDVAVQISVVTAIAAVAAAHTPVMPAWVPALFAGTWMVNLVTSVLAGGPTAASLITHRSPLITAVKLVRDYGAVIALAAMIAALVPQWTVWLMLGLSVVNGTFLLAAVTQAARATVGSGAAERP